MDTSSVAGGLLVLFVWGFGVWKAAEVWSHPFLNGEPKENRKANKPGSILPKLFWICHGLLLLAAVTRMLLDKEMFRPIWMPALMFGEIGLIALGIHVENATKVEPQLIRLSTQHKLKTKSGYEGALYWTRAFWVFEKPRHIFGATFLFIGSILLSIFNNVFELLALFSFNLLFCLFIFCRYTTLMIKKDGVIVHRWLESFPTTKISNTDIVSVQIDKPILHRIFGVMRLTIKKTGNKYLRISLNDPMKAKEYLEHQA